MSSREVQKELGLSSPALSSFHLDKLTAAGLVAKDADGRYYIEKTYLKHYVRLRRFLIPRYFFYATLAAFFGVGWFVLLLSPQIHLVSGLKTPYGFTIIAFFGYGVVVTVILGFFFWYETYKVMQTDKL